MMVYVVQWGDAADIIDIFSSMESAEQSVKNYIKNNNYHLEDVWRGAPGWAEYFFDNDTSIIIEPWQVKVRAT